MDLYIYIHIYTYACTHTRAYMHTHIYVNIYIHIHIHTYMDTYTYTYAHTSTFTYMPMHIYIYMYIYIYRICTSYREREANLYADVHNICLTYTSAHAWCATTPVNACWLCAKNAYGLVYACLFNCAAAFLPRRLLRTYLESCANIVPAVVYCPPHRPPSCRQSVSRRCSLKKSHQIHASSWRGRHCGVALASSDHPRWCRPHPVWRLPVTEMHFRHFCARPWGSR